MKEIYELVAAGLSMIGASRWMKEHNHRTVSGRPWGREDADHKAAAIVYERGRQRLRVHLEVGGTHRRRR